MISPHHLNLSCRPTKGIADLPVVLPLLPHAQTSNDTETAFAAGVFASSGGGSGGSDGRVVEEFWDSVFFGSMQAFRQLSQMAVG